MKKFVLAITAATACLGLAASSVSAAPLARAPQSDHQALVQKAGGIYLDFGGPRNYGYGGYYDRYPAYGYGYYASPRRYYRDGYRYGRYGHHGRRWAQERFQHPLGRR
jgi:hypothetical protein